MIPYDVPSPRKLHGLIVSLVFIMCTAAAPCIASGAAQGSSGAAAQQQQELHNWLYSEFLFESLDAPVMARLTAAEKAAIDYAPRNRVPRKVGLGKAVNETVRFSDFRSARNRVSRAPGSAGFVTASDDGGFVYSLTLSSPDAAGIRVHFTNFAIPDDAELYLFTDDGQVAGPYWGLGPLGTGEFWSHTLFSDFVMLQVRHFGPAPSYSQGHSGFKVAGIGHIRGVFQQGLCGYNEACIENAECVSGGVTDELSRAVALMLFQSGASFFICSGGLIADTDASSDRPLFLTANHCISRNNEAQSLETFFQHTTPCGSTSNCAFPEGGNTLGSSILSKGKQSDYTLLELSQQPPGNSHFLGWNPNPVANSDGTGLARISHPSGAPQAYSEHDVDTDAVTCGGLPRGNFIYSRDTFGATEGGSSGSPVVDANGNVVGQLYGGCGFNIGDVCDAENNATVDGAFASYFSNIQDILDPQGCPATETACDDGLDNDCDGLIDAEDPDCDDGGGDGLPAGSPCTSDSECASGKCRGRPGGMICR